MKTPQVVVQDFFAVFSTGDVDRIVACLTHDATWWVSGKLPQISGSYSRDAFEALLRQAVALYTDRALRITPTAMICEGSRVAVEAEGFAQLTDGRLYANQYHFRIDVDGNLIRQVKEYSDTQHMLETFSPR